MSPARIITILLPAVLASAPSYAWRDLPLQRIIRNVHKVKSFEGTIVQSGLLDGREDVKADVAFALPNHFSARVVEPAAWAGTAVTYDGRTLVQHFPQIRYAVRFRNLTLPSGEDADRLIEYQYQRDVGRYEYSISGTSQVASLTALTLHHQARSKDAFDRKGWTKVYDPFSFALAGELDLQGPASYGYRYERIAFNGAVGEGAFEASIPEGTLVTEWDLAAPAIDEAKMRGEAKFEIALPEDRTMGLEKQRIVRVAGPIPAYCVRYQRNSHSVYAIAFNAQGATVPEYGVPVDVRGARGRLILGPSMSSLSFVQGGTYYAFLGNLPVDELVMFARARTASSDPTAPRHASAP